MNARQHLTSYTKRRTTFPALHARWAVRGVAKDWLLRIGEETYVKKRYGKVVRIQRRLAQVTVQQVTVLDHHTHHPSPSSGSKVPS